MTKTLDGVGATIECKVAPCFSKQMMSVGIGGDLKIELPLTVSIPQFKV